MGRIIREIALCVVMVLAAVPGGQGATRGAQGLVAEARQIRCQSESGYIRIVLELDKKVPYTCNTLHDDPNSGMPSRIYVDLSRTKCAKGLLRTKAFSEGPIKAVRIGQYDTRTTRLVVDIRKLGDYKVMTLSSPERIVIDLWTDKTESTTKSPATLSAADKKAVPKARLSKTAVSPKPTPLAGADNEVAAKAKTPKVMADSRPSFSASPEEKPVANGQSPEVVVSSQQAPTASKDEATSKDQVLPNPEPPKPTVVAGKSPVSVKTPRIRRIVIDAGHGGKDPGAVGRRGLKEKDVALRLAKRLKTKLEKSLNAEVFLTRSRDIYLPLGKRTSIANQKKADLFISIHANGHHDRLVSGIETYYLDNTTDKAAIRLAALENASSGHEHSDLQRILTDLRRNSNVLESNALAHIVQDSLCNELTKEFHGVVDNGAKANLFYVLMGADMPSILVEVSYISNLEEERYLKSEKYLERIADGILNGISRYTANQYLPTLQAQR